MCFCLCKLLQLSCEVKSTLNVTNNKPRWNLAFFFLDLGILVYLRLRIGTNNKTCFGPVQGQLRWLLADIRAGYGPRVALVFNPVLGHFRAVILCGTWAEGKVIVWPGAGPENICYVGI